MRKESDSVIGGEFLLNDVNCKNVFTLEDFTEDQRMMADS